jgi:hypothetical protein
VASDWASEPDALDCFLAQPSAETACERLRLQVRLLLESRDLAANPLGAYWREAEELKRIRTYPGPREVE